jgi:bile acid-coenzyme A ligase
VLPIATSLARHPPDAIALIHGSERWTFAKLNARSDQWACWLATKGISSDSLIAFSRPNGPEFMAISFGIYKVGCTPAPVSNKLPDFEREAILSVMRPALFIKAEDLPDVNGRDLPALHIATSWKACTSGGSTGTPKVIVDGRSAGFAEGTDFIGIPDAAPVLVPGPLYHNAPFSAAVFALWKGCTVITMDRFDAVSALQLISSEHIAWSMMVPTMMHRIMALPDEVRNRDDLSCWKMVVHTAAPMARWLKESWIAWRGPDHIWEVYGATEGLVRCWIGGREWLLRPGSVGRPIGGARIRIMNDSGQEVPTGDEGEIYAMPAGGPGSSYRYIGAERRATADGWESVGDIGRVDADGYLYLSDRRSDLIISGGVNVWPAEVEAAILRHPDVGSCAVYGVHNSDLGQTVHAVIESSDAKLTVETLSDFLAPWLSRQKHPRSIQLQSNPVRDDAGKFRKNRSN